MKTQPFLTPLSKINAAAAAAAAPPADSHPSLLAAIEAQPRSERTLGVVEALKLRGTLANPALALTVLLPEDQYFDALAEELGITPQRMLRNAGLMRQGERVRERQTAQGGG